MIRRGDKKNSSFIMENYCFHSHESDLFEGKSEMIITGFILHGYCKKWFAVLLNLLDTSHALSIEHYPRGAT